MRIGMLSQWFDPEPGPASLPGALARSLHERGHEVRVLTGFPNYPTGSVHPDYPVRWRSEELMSGVEVRRVALYPSHSSSVAGRLLNYGSFGTTSLSWGASWLKDCDAVWLSNSPITVAAPMWRLAKIYGIPIHLHVMDLWPDNVVSSSLIDSSTATRVVSRALHGWTSWMYRTAGHVSTLSPGIARLLEDRGVESHKLSVIPMWANEKAVTPADPATFRRAKSVPDDHVVVLYGGALGRTQAIDSLIEAVGRYPAAAPPLTVWIAGSGVEGDRLRALAADVSGTNVSLEFLGQVPGDSMPEVMAAADLHFVGLKDDPNSAITVPSKVQATMAAGKPMLVAVPGDARAMVLEADAGLGANPGDPNSIADALVAAASMSRDQLHAMGQNARVAYDRGYSLRSGTDRVEQVLHSIARRH